MVRHVSPMRVPRAYIDPIVEVTQLLALLELMVSRPLQWETITLFLDAERRGCGATMVEGTWSADAVIDVAGCMAGAVLSVPEIEFLVLVSVRPGDTLVAADRQRLHEARLVIADQGLELIDWIVIGRRGPEFPRTLAGEPDPWTS